MKITETTTATIKSISYETGRSWRNLFKSNPITKVVISTGNDEYEAHKNGHDVQLKEGQKLWVEINKDYSLTAQLKRLVGKDPDLLKLYLAPIL